MGCLPNLECIPANVIAIGLPEWHMVCEINMTCLIAMDAVDDIYKTHL